MLGAQNYRTALQAGVAAAVKLSCCVISLAALYPACSSASTVSYNLTGQITQIGPMNSRPVAIGQLVAISITVEQQSASAPSTPGSQVYDGYHFGSPSGSLIDSAFINGTDYASLAQRIVVTAGSGITFNTAGPQINYGFHLELGGALPGVLPTTDLPGSLLPGQFASGSFAAVDAFTASSYGYSGTIVGLAEPSAVPEPGSMLVLVSGLMMAGLVLRLPLQR